MSGDGASFSRGRIGARHFECHFPVAASHPRLSNTPYVN